jgi:hypothetical protein
MDGQQKILYVGQQHNVRLGPEGCEISRTRQRVNNLSQKFWLINCMLYTKDLCFKFRVSWQALVVPHGHHCARNRRVRL